MGCLTFAIENGKLESLMRAIPNYLPHRRIYVTPNGKNHFMLSLQLEEGEVDLIPYFNEKLDLAIKEAESACKVTEMGLCEVRGIVLRPNQLYRFLVMPGCEKCKAEDVYSKDN